MKEMSKNYSTQSLYEASFLLAKGFELTSKDSTGQKTTLLFEDSPELRQAVIAFYNGRGIIRAKVFVESYRSLKDMVFQR